ncbi:Bloom syndrome protein homolog [Daphnia pulicaria]|uniref:Bloom syndrome protein homolog n=1 Tax=Daphnia pulicaria TaxID=35523 RepID=UPI001EEAA29C|nr:Bloom syndrome protein homolog [Daphnia pulicaria]
MEEESMAVEECLLDNDVIIVGESSRVKSVDIHSRKSAKELLGFSILKPQQVEVVEAALSKRDCLVVMPTVSGKSACFLLPGLIEHGVTIVISPLKSLICDELHSYLTENCPSDEIPHVSDDELENLEISFASTIDLTMDEEIDEDLVKEEQKRRMSDEDDGCMQVKRKKIQ